MKYPSIIDNIQTKLGGMDYLIRVHKAKGFYSGDSTTLSFYVLNSPYKIRISLNWTEWYTIDVLKTTTHKSRLIESYTDIPSDCLKAKFEEILKEL